PGLLPRRTAFGNRPGPSPFQLEGTMALVGLVFCNPCTGAPQTRKNYQKLFAKQGFRRVLRREVFRQPTEVPDADGRNRAPCAESAHPPGGVLPDDWTSPEPPRRGGTIHGTPLPGAAAMPRAKRKQDGPHLADILRETHRKHGRPEDGYDCRRVR